MRNISKYEDEYLSTDFEQKYQVYYRRKKVLEILREVSHKRILEIGCGMQSIGAFVEDFEEFTIVEPGERFADKAINDLQDKEGVRIVKGFLEESIEVLKERTYDLIICSSLLHEVEEPIGMLQAIKHLCNKNTMVHINVPNEFSIHRILAYESGLIESINSKSQRNILLQQNSVFNLKNLEETICKTGKISIYSKGSFFIKPFTHEQMEQCLERGIIDEKILEGFYRLTEYLPEYGSEIFINYQYMES